MAVWPLRGIQIFSELQRSYKADKIEEVRLIKDKKTGISRQFAFVQFIDVEDATAFLERNYPSIQLYGRYEPSQAADAQGARVRIAYSREKEDRVGRGDDDWDCDVCHLSNYSHRLMCFRCNAPRTHQTATGIMGIVKQQNMSTFSGFATTGDSDASPDNAASQFILLRGLEPGVNEELLAKGVAKLYKIRAEPPEVHVAKKSKIASTSNDANLGAPEGSLRRVLLVRDRKTSDSWRYGFAEFASVDDAQAAVAKFNASEKFTISSKPVMVSYIHAGVFVPVLQPQSEDSDRFTFNPLANPAMRLMYWDESAYVSELVTALEGPSSSADANEKLSTKTAAAGFSDFNVKDKDAKSKKRKVEKEAPSSVKKVVAPHLQFWSNRHAEIHGLPVKDVNTEESSVQEAEAAPPSQSFADMDRNCCLLCSRQFKTASEVHKHERMSQLHRDNMLSEEFVAKAQAKLAKSQAAKKSNIADIEDGSAYRDRAKERRQAFNQPKQPAAQHGKHKDLNDSGSKTAKEEQEEDNPPPVPSKGAALLGKMGWTAGEGLGATGSGRTEAIQTDLYSQGVGLGAEGGKVGDALVEANRSTKGGYREFVMKSRDKAKERFEKMA